MMMMTTMTMMTMMMMMNDISLLDAQFKVAHEKRGLNRTPVNGLNYPTLSEDEEDNEDHDHDYMEDDHCHSYHRHCRHS